MRCRNASRTPRNHGLHGVFSRMHRLIAVGQTRCCPVPAREKTLGTVREGAGLAFRNQVVWENAEPLVSKLQKSMTSGNSGGGCFWNALQASKQRKLMQTPDLNNLVSAAPATTVD